MSDAEVLPGGINKLEGDKRQKALDLLDASLAHLAAEDGPSYKVLKVTSVTGQVVAGTLYRYKVELDNGSDQKQSSVEIWTQPWLKENGTNIKIKCDGEDEELDRTW